MDTYTVDTIHRLLLQIKLITPQDILHNDYEVTSMNRRNKNLQVTTNQEKNYLIKQVSDRGAENARTLTTELRFYQSVADNFPELQKYFPNVFYTDEQDILLILEFYKNAVPLWKYYKEKGIDRMPMNTVADAGKVLASVHEKFKDCPKTTFPYLNDALPFAFELHKPDPKILAYIRKGGYQFIENLQQDATLCMIIEELSANWKGDALIHGDIKLDNMIVIPGNNETDDPELRLIDWEMVQYGDLAWDIAGGFQDFIFWWIIMMPEGETPEEMIQNATFSFSRLQPAINAYWDAYVQTRKLTNEENEVLLKRVVRYSGLRCLQTAYEIATKFEYLPPIALLLWNTGESILKNDEMAREKLYGIIPDTIAL